AASVAGKPRVLEIGCGSGYFPSILGKAPVDFTGLDLFEEHLARAREKTPHFKFLQGSAYQLPFENEQFDFVVSIYVFEHLTNLPACLEEVRRVLKPGGRLLVGLPAEGGLAYGLGRRLTSCRHFSEKYGIDYMRIIRAEHCNTAADVVHELRKQFHVSASRYYPFRVPSIHLAAMLAYECETNTNS
ncbi:MAG: class I SAM-dependent methyltransferase, partial [Chthoniobacteraceae bacterium]